MTGTPPLRLHTTTFDHPLHKRFFYPTTGSAQYRLDAKNNTIRKGTTNQSSYESPRQTGTGRLEYNSRKARKARHALKTHHIQHHPEGSDKPSTSPANVTVRVDSVRSEFKPHLKLDITFWLAVTFVLGSSVWVVNGKSDRVVSSSSCCELNADYDIYVSSTFCPLSIRVHRPPTSLPWTYRKLREPDLDLLQDGFSSSFRRWSNLRGRELLDGGRSVEQVRALCGQRRD